MRFLLAIGLCLTCFALAESADERSAREEVEHDLRQEVRVPPASIEIRFEGIDSTRYELLESSFSLDGKPLPSPLTPGKIGRQKQILFFGIVSPGPHAFAASLTFREVSGPASVFSYVSGYKFKIPYGVTLEAQKGLVLKVRTSITVDDGQADLKKRLQFVGEIEPYMVAKVDDAPMEVRDAGTPDAGVAPAPAVATKGKRKRGPPGKPYTQMKTGDWKKKKHKSKKPAQSKTMARLKKSLRGSPDAGM